MRLALATAITLVLAGRARADVVMPPRDACPPGAIPVPSHAGPFCMPSQCEAAADCETWRHRLPAAATLECAEAGLCVGTRHLLGGRGGRGDLPVAYGSCRVGSDCPTGVPCELTTRCIAPGSILGPVPASMLPPIVARAGASSTCGATGVIGMLVIAIAASGFAARSRARARRAEAVLATLRAQGRASERDLARVAGDAELVARALAPLAHRLRVDVDDQGETQYALDDAEVVVREARRVDS